MLHEFLPRVSERSRWPVRIAGVLMLIASTILAGAPPSKAPRVRAAVISTADTARIVLHWTAVKDVRGDPVTRYVWRLESGAALLAMDSTVTLADTVSVARPLPGDSLIVGARVAARDAKGYLGAWGISNLVVIRGRLWVPPGAPVVTIDTVALVKPDSVSLYAVAYNPQDTVGVRYFVTRGDTLELCATAWVSNKVALIDVAPVWKSDNTWLLWPAGVGSHGSNCQRIATNPFADVGALNRALRIAHWVGQGEATKRALGD